MLMAPQARIDDGWFDVVVVGAMTRASLLAAFPLIFRGAHERHPAVRVFRARHVRVVTDPPQRLLPDGELFGSTPTEFAVQPAAVRYFA
jgi:diacylglycerol kinase (ATP)